MVVAGGESSALAVEPSRQRHGDETHMGGDEGGYPWCCGGGLCMVELCSSVTGEHDG
jgi:hypothetical protein